MSHRQSVMDDGHGDGASSHRQSVSGAQRQYRPSHAGWSHAWLSQGILTSFRTPQRFPDDSGTPGVSLQCWHCPSGDSSEVTEGTQHSWSRMRLRMG